MCTVARAGKCVDCGTELTNVGGRGRPRLRCDSCVRSHLKQKNRARYGKPPKTSKYPMVPCLNCSQQFRFRPGCNVDFCKLACKLEWNEKQKQHTCEHCGAGFLRQPRHTSSSREKDALRFCSRKCGLGARYERTATAGACARLNKSLANWFHGWECNRVEVIRKEDRQNEREGWKCMACGVPASDRVRPAKHRYCSHECYRSHSIDRPCFDCGNVFTTTANRPQRRCGICQEIKRKENARQARKAAKHKKGNHRKRCCHYGVEYDPAITAKSVFERDGYSCQLCGVETLRRFAKNMFGDVDSRSPTVDHIVPLHWRQKGHTWDNVRLCCWQCNCIVRNREGHAETMRKRPRPRKPRSVA